MHRFDTLRRGLLAGILASLVLALFDFVTDGAPGSGFPAVLRWFGFTVADPTITHWGGLLLLIVLGKSIWPHLWGAPARQAQHHWPRTPHRACAEGPLVAAL